MWEGSTAGNRSRLRLAIASCPDLFAVNPMIPKSGGSEALAKRNPAHMNVHK